jgi:hypothetical protein
MTMSGFLVLNGSARRCIRTTPRGLIAKISTALVMPPHFVHIGATRLDAIGSGRFPRLAAVSVFAEKNPDFELERA